MGLEQRVDWSVASLFLFPEINARMSRLIVHLDFARMEFVRARSNVFTAMSAACHSGARMEAVKTELSLERNAIKASVCKIITVDPMERVSCSS
jgi:hypothetical protein